jgi:hypothetical protein
MRSSQNGNKSLIADDSAEYSDSMVHVSISLCSLDDQTTGQFAMQIANPVLELTQVGLIKRISLFFSNENT